MNDRIKELAEQAGCDIADVEIFAYLLIKDCCSIIMSDKVISWTDSIRISKNITEEFGVK